MKEREEFDDYIKGLFNEEQEVPEGFEWEAMNIELPKVVKNNKTYKKYLGLLVLLLFGTSVSLLLFSKKGKQKKPFNNIVTIDELKDETAIKKSKLLKSKSETGNEIRPTKNNQALNKTSSTKLTAFEKNELRKAELNTTNLIQETSLQNTNTIKNEPKFFDNGNPKNKDYAVESSKTKIGELPPSTSEIIAGETINQINSTKSLTNRSNLVKQNQLKVNVLTKNIGITNNKGGRHKIEKLNSNKADGLAMKSNLEEVNIPSKTNTEILIVEQDIFSNIKPLPLILANNLSSINQSIELKRYQKFNKKITKDKVTLVFAYGYNTFNLNVEEDNILKDKLNNVFGSSFVAGVKIKLNNNWKSNVLLNLNQFHSTFEHSRDLESVYDIENSLKIKRKEVTFHNNYTNVLGLQVGVERSLYSINEFQLKAGASLVPASLLSTMGKTIKNGQVEKLVHNNDSGKFSLGGALNVTGLYSVSKSISLEAGYQLNYIFVNEIFINDNVSSDMQNIFTIGFNYKL